MPSSCKGCAPKCRSTAARNRVLFRGCRRCGCCHRAAKPGLRCDGPRARCQAGCPCGLSWSTTTAPPEQRRRGPSQPRSPQPVRPSLRGSTRRSQPTDRYPCRTLARVLGGKPHHVPQGPYLGVTAPTCRCRAHNVEREIRHADPHGSGSRSMQSEANDRDLCGTRDFPPPAIVRTCACTSQPLGGPRCRTRPATCRSHWTASSLGRTRAGRSPWGSGGGSCTAGTSATRGPTTLTRSRTSGSCAPGVRM